MESNVNVIATDEKKGQSKAQKAFHETLYGIPTSFGFASKQKAYCQISGKKVGQYF